MLRTSGHSRESSTCSCDNVFSLSNSVLQSKPWERQSYSCVTSSLQRLHQGERLRRDGGSRYISNVLGVEQVLMI